MNLSAIKDFLNHENPRFICTAEPDGSSHDSFTAQVEHRMTEPEGDDLQSLAGGLDQLIELYSTFGSLRLYCDAKSSSSAFYLAKPSEWRQLRQEFLSWIRMLGAEQERPMPEWTETSVVFGEIPETGNYLMMPQSGSDAGKVFLFDHESCDFEEEAPDLAAYITALTSPGDALFRKIRSNTRYSDGETATQWLVQDYASGE